MCRFVMYFGEALTLDRLTTEPTHSLIHQSYKARERREPLNGDGFGIAWYAHDISPEPAVFRSTTPAWSNTNLRQLARVTTSGCVFAHVRAASPLMARYRRSHTSSAPSCLIAVICCSISTVKA